MGAQPRVLLDATAIPAERGGVGRYLEGLVAGLDEVGADLSIACQARDAHAFGELAPQARVVACPPRTAGRPARLAWEQAGLPRLVRRLGVQVLHSPHYTMPLAAPVPVVVTVHDATFFSDPRVHSAVKGRFFRSWTKITLRRAACCIVPSAATAHELERLAGAEPGRLVVAHHGVDPAVFRPPAADESAALARHLGLGGTPWVAFLGTLEPRKNVPALVRAFTAVCGDRPDAPALVLAGSPGWDPGVEPAVAAAAGQARVIRAGHLPYAMLPGLLGGAQLVAYPSLGEGFGLPVLEAMACGAAVLTTRRLSLPEVGGDAVSYCDTAEGGIAEGLRDLLDAPDRRAALGAAALARAAGFTWKASAEAHLRAYREAAGA